MKKIGILLLSLFMCSALFAATDADCQAAIALSRRVMGEKASRQIVFKKSTRAAQQDCFTLSQKGSKVQIEGNNAGSMATGLGYYLKNYCHCNYSWMTSDPLVLPSKLPSVGDGVTINATVSKRFFLNYCTFGYTMPWWQWEDWSHFIDWMALNGVNMALAITGQESIWYKIWTEMGLTDAQIRDYFTGPAHLPWHRMQNVDRWFSPLPQSWLDSQLDLQKLIVERERSLGITPVLPAFNGHVPREIMSVYPDAPLSELGGWSGFTGDMGCSFLDPMSPLFSEIQERFIRKESEIYGTDHVYGVDIFNEVMPPSSDPQYLARVSRQIYESISQADPDAVWLQMGWLFYNARKYWNNERVDAYLSSFPKERQLMLDYYCDKKEVWESTNAFFGVPFIWCYLGNFGGNTNLCGVPADIQKKLSRIKEESVANFSGIGCTLEGLDCNPYIYEFVLSQAWEKPQKAENLAGYLASCRTRSNSAEAVGAWTALMDSVYIGPTATGQSSLLCHRPNIGKSKTRYATAAIPYDNAVLLRALKQLLRADGSGPAYSFDVVNLMRQWLSNRFNELKGEYDKAYHARDLDRMDRLSADMLDILDHLDNILAADSFFLLGKWISDARYWGKDSVEKLYFERNARNLITSWSDSDMILNDYAARALNGLVRDYYKPRYVMFFEAVHSCVRNGLDWDEQQYDIYNRKVTAFEHDWWDKPQGSYISQPVGDAVTIARQILEKLGEYN